MDLLAATSPPNRRPEAQPPPLGSTAATSPIGQRPVTLLPDPRFGLAGGLVSPCPLHGGATSLWGLGAS